jgi:hypothetical protein
MTVSSFGELPLVLPPNQRQLLLTPISYETAQKFSYLSIILNLIMVSYIRFQRLDPLDGIS